MRRAARLLRPLPKPSPPAEQVWYREMKERVAALLSSPASSSGAALPAEGTELEPDSIRSLLRRGAAAGGVGRHFPLDLTMALCSLYASLPADQRHGFLHLLAAEAQLDNAHVGQCAAALSASLANSQSAPAQLARQVQDVRNALTPLYERWFQQIIALPNGLKFLIDLRADLLVSLRKDPTLQLMLLVVVDLLRRAFTVEWLQLEHITWDSRCSVLERVMEGESVHNVSDFSELKKRLSPTPGRRCYGFFHPSMPNEPLVFIKVALTKEVVSGMSSILHAGTSSEEGVNTAMFYSISSTQQGLKGIDLGSLLIKQVVEHIRASLPSMPPLAVPTGVKQFSTISPIPGFVPWVNALRDDTLLQDDRTFLLSAAQSLGLTATDGRSSLQALVQVPKWWERPELGALKDVILRLAIKYLYLERRDDAVLDAVANFHLKNGAMLYRLNWLADMSDKRMSQSYGIMVNYYYERTQIARNSQSYQSEGHVATGEPFQALLRRYQLAA